MTQRIKELLISLRTKEHHIYRKSVDYLETNYFEENSVPVTKRVTSRFLEVLKNETPIIMKNQRIVFMRTVKNLPEIFTKNEMENIKNKNYFIHEIGRVCNIAGDYERIINNGLEYEKNKCIKLMDSANGEEKFFLESIIESINGIYEIADRYKKLAEEQGLTEVAKVLRNVPRQKANSFLEALQFFRILHFSLWCEGVYHNIVGRFDQYMYPYMKNDLDKGILTRDEAQELLEEFFITFNLDSDLYVGVQQGDNGQSMMLGGVDKKGNNSFNELSSMCLKASKNLLLIDPKINLRVNKNTPLELYKEGTELTKVGLGFPQYSNDDIVIEGLVKKGYDLEDARDYTVAACWEFIIPKVAMDIPNIGSINFPSILNHSFEKYIYKCQSYEEFYSCFFEEVGEKCREILDRVKNIYIVSSPVMSLMMKDCIENKRDIALGSKYNNYGYHGVGIATAVDALAVIKKCIFDELSLSKDAAIAIIKDKDFSEEIFLRLRYEEKKFGSNDELTNKIACNLINDFGNSVEGLVNERGGCVRAGTGTAMYYLWHAASMSNALSGHRKGENYSANYAPELFVKDIGPLSNIMSLSSPDFTQAINGGPLTIEFHSSVFKNNDGIDKVAKLIKQFIVNGGHQLQLNSVNAEIMRQAQKKPDEYKNLIVRIWGWSAYFVELDKEYQDHVIQRHEFSI
ncbi:MAG: pyruvate formate lyase family protein [Lachnospirales bacterium]